MARGLTRRQEGILKYIINYTLTNFYQPTIREIGDRFGISSTNGVTDHLKSLERKGYIRQKHARVRAIEFTPKTLEQFGLNKKES